ncbi:MAG: DUF3298 and DUF4163 domain-containing protein [Oscillospiraceae bacterium]|nr:DUF3298 and DUF4163 domain-containing protein [Oscillospiraceae bacterium]
MNKFLALLLALAMSLALVACAGRTQTDAPATSSLSGSVSEAPTESSQEEAPEASTDPADQSEASVQPEEEAFVPAQVVFRQVDASAFAEDDVMLLNCSYVEPVVTMADSEIQQKIQQSLDEVLYGVKDLRDFYTESSQEEYDSMGEEESFALVDENGNYVPYFLSLEGRVARSDETVLSVVFDEQMYTHGAHGQTQRFCCNYDVRTGEIITFAQLGKENFRSVAAELVLAKSEEIAAQRIQDGEMNPFYPDYQENIRLVILDGTETDFDLWGEEFTQGAPITFAPTYYLSEEHVVFISTEYTLQPYAAGTIEFEIPYADFGDVLNPEYVPQS